MAGINMDDTEMALDMEAHSEASSDLAAGVSAAGNDSQLESISDSSSNPVAFDLPDETCGHCWMHSQVPSGSATVVSVDPSKRITETDAPLTKCAVALPSALPVPIKPSAHGPPGNSFPRHILINVFRI